MAITLYLSTASEHRRAGGPSLSPLAGAVIAIMFRFTPDNTASAWLEPLLDATPTTLLFSKFVQLAASNQFAAKNNSVEAESPGTLDLGQIVAQADPTKFFTCVPPAASSCLPSTGRRPTLLTAPLHFRPMLKFATPTGLRDQSWLFRGLRGQSWLHRAA